MCSCNDVCDAFDVYARLRAALEPVMSAGSLPPTAIQVCRCDLEMSGLSLFLCVLLCAIYEGLMPPWATLGAILTPCPLRIYHLSADFHPHGNKYIYMRLHT